MRIWASVALVVVGGCTCSEKTKTPAALTAAPREAVGGVLNADPKQNAVGPSLAAGPTGPIVAWRENDVIQVRAWSGSGWDLAGGRTLGKRAVEAPVVSRALDGTVWVAWKELDAKDAVQGRVAKLAGKEWQDEGVLTSSGMRQLLFSAETTPVVFGWTEAEGDLQHVQLRELRGDRWNSGRLVGTKTGTVLQPMTVSPLASRTPAVVFLEKDAGAVKVRVAKWEAGAHAMLVEPGGADDDSVVSAASLGDGTVLLAMSHASGLLPVRALKTAAAAWGDVGLPEGAATAGLPRIAASGTVAALSYFREGTHVAKWTQGGAWQQLDAKLEAAGGNPAPVAVGPDGTVYVAALAGEPAQLKVFRYK